MKRVLYFVIGLALVGFGTYKYSKFRVDQANAQRYDKIYSSSRFTSSPKTKIITLWQFPLGPIVESTSRTISGPHPFRESELPELYRHFSDRRDYLRRLRRNSNEIVCGTLSWNLQGKTMRSVYVSEIGVEVVPIQTGANLKYKAIDMAFGGAFLTADLGQPILLPKQRERVTRDNFVNPEDIDWMFDVKDFSKINAYATIIP